MEYYIMMWVIFVIAAVLNYKTTTGNIMIMMSLLPLIMAVLESNIIAAIVKQCPQ